MTTSTSISSCVPIPCSTSGAAPELFCIAHVMLGRAGASVGWIRIWPCCAKRGYEPTSSGCWPMLPLLPGISEFELAVMTGHAFQMLISDDAVRHSLKAIRTALVENGRFAFETRHPQARAWEDWHGSSFDVHNPNGEASTVTYEVEKVAEDVIRLSETLTGRWWDDGHTDIGELRFLSPSALAAFLNDAGFIIEEQFGDWQRHPLSPASKEIITIARRC